MLQDDPKLLYTALIRYITDVVWQIVMIICYYEMCWVGEMGQGEVHVLGTHRV